MAIGAVKLQLISLKTLCARVVEDTDHRSISPCHSVPIRHCARLKFSEKRTNQSAKNGYVEIVLAYQPQWQVRLMKSHPDIASRHGSIFACGEEGGSYTCRVGRAI